MAGAHPAGRILARVHRAGAPLPYFYFRNLFKKQPGQKFSKPQILLQITTWNRQVGMQNSTNPPKVVILDFLGTVPNFSKILNP